MKRQDAIDAINITDEWDFIIIGGGATGLGCAVDAAARGYRTLLIEQHDFAKGTSSRSTKLVHGGVRYLKQGNISLVLEALKERGLMCENAKHLCHHQAFVIPIYSWWDGPFYGVGLKVYDSMAGRLGLKPSRMLSKEETLEHIPTLETEGLKGGVMYYDGQFDDSRFAINLAQTVFDLGGTAINYVKAAQLLKTNGLVCGVLAHDSITGCDYEIKAKVVINATGVFSDALRKADDANAKTLLSASQGVHLVLPKSFLPGKHAIMVPKTSDGRVLFAVPWHDKVVVGTTDTPQDTIKIEPIAQEDEIEFILKNAAQYLAKDPTHDDILSVFAGLRPLVKADDKANTASLSRDHTLIISESGLLTITGGKWTTYRKMAEDTIDKAELVAGLDHRNCITETLAIHGSPSSVIDDPAPLSIYGTDAENIHALIDQDERLASPLSDKLPYLKAEVIWAVKHEMAQTVEDILARRTRALLLDAKASMEAAPIVTVLVAKALGHNEQWESEALAQYQETAASYCGLHKKNAQ